MKIARKVKKLGLLLTLSIFLIAPDQSFAARSKAKLKQKTKVAKKTTKQTAKKAKKTTKQASKKTSKITTKKKAPAKIEAVQKEKPKSRSSSDLKLFNFRLFLLGALQDEGTNNAFSAGLGWAPEYSFNKYLGVAASIGAKPLLGKTFNDIFISIEYALLIILKGLGPFYLELGAGGETWTSHGTYPMAKANAGFFWGPWVFERMYLGASAVNVSDELLTYEFVAGLGLGF